MSKPTKRTKAPAKTGAPSKPTPPVQSPRQLPVAPPASSPNAAIIASTATPSPAALFATKAVVEQPRSTPVAELSKSAPKPAASSTRPGSVHLEFVRPEANKVCVAGSFNGWKPESTPLKSAGNGRWVADLNVQPGKHEYLFVVDGQWVPDPNARETVANPYGGSNSVLTVG